MSTPELAIAKVNFSAVLFRKDPAPLTRPEIESFHTLLADAIARCSPANVQKCKRWILANIRPSAARIAALTKYLVALSASFAAGNRDSKAPSPKRRCLHVLHILSDVLYQTDVRDRDSAFAAELQPGLPALLHNAAAFKNCPKHTEKLETLVDLWDERRHFPGPFIDELRDVIREAPLGGKVFKGTSTTTDRQAPAATRSGKDAPYILPSVHGDPSAAWYDLPAANWLPHLTPNSTKPMHPDMIRPLQLASGPADKALAQAVKDLLRDVERIYSRGGGPRDEDEQNTRLSELGERVIIDEITGDVIGGETYYGWSREFCEKMKQRRKKAKLGPGTGRGRDTSRSPSRSRSLSRSSRSPSPPAFKRRRLSRDSPSPDRRPSPGRRAPRRRSYSRSRSPSRTPPRRYRSRSRSRDRNYRGGQDRSPSPRGQDRSGARRHEISSYHNLSRTPSAPPPAPVPHHQHIHRPIPSLPHPPPMPAGGFGQFPPPPPPQGFHGQWPPPPPPPPPQLGGGPPPGWIPPPPPNMAGPGGWRPQQPHDGPQGPYQGYGRGGHRGGRGGRGGHDRGRGW